MNPTASEESLIARLLELPPEARAEHLRRVYVEQPDLRDRLRKIAQAVTSLEAESERTPLPSSDAERARVMELAFTHQELAGSMIGPYKLLQEIGEGGFGVVWMAEQQEPIRRRVALKVIKSGMDSREVIARFEVERQALALMDHPFIARVFDAGTTEGGRPYFVMELVRGIPITRYCDESRLPTEARLRLFISVCQAVQHAHQKGVIHRDLKPSNIIVTLHDGVATPKIIDFGIAKATEAQLTEKTLFTRFHAFIGTPAYTSPEQMEMSGLDVDTRSDIYSLGVLLYELLAGRPPFDPGDLLRSSLEEMRRTIREVEPPRPSQCVRTLSGDLCASVSRNRATQPATLTELLRGDLDWIVMRCLEKDRTRRYETASGLAADVRRYLANEPVTARPASAAYRLQKLVRRHRLGFAAGAAVVLSLVVGLIVASLALMREHDALERESGLRVEADANAAQARSEASRSNQVARFMKDMLAGVGPSGAQGRDTTMLREILDETERRLEAELGDQPEVAADLRETLALVYRELGRYKEAEAILHHVVATYRTLFGGRSEKLARSLTSHGGVLQQLNRPAEAEASLQEALAIRLDLFGGDHPGVADTLFELAQVFMRGRTVLDSENLLNEALRIRRNAYGGEHPAVAETIEALGLRARWELNHRRAIELHTEALSMYRRLLGNDHPAVARSLDNLGDSLRHIAWTPEAMEPYREAFFLRRKVLSPAHPQLVVSMLRHIGQIPAAKADDEAIALLREFIAGQREVLPRQSPLLAPSLLALAVLLDRPGRNSQEAVELTREAHELIDESLAGGPALDIQVVDAMTLYGWWKFMDGDAAEGRVMCEAGLRLSRGAHGETHSAVAVATHFLGWVNLGTLRFDDAVVHFGEALRIMRELFPPHNVFISIDVAGLGAAYRESGRLAESRKVLEEALESWKWGTDPAARVPPSIPIVMCELGLTLNAEGRFAEAERVLRGTIEQYDKGKVTEVAMRLVPRARAEGALGTALTAQGRFEEAEPLLLHAFEEIRTNLASYGGDRPAMLRSALDAVVNFYATRGMPDKVAYWRSVGP